MKNKIQTLKFTEFMFIVKLVFNKYAYLNFIKILFSFIAQIEFHQNDVMNTTAAVAIRSQI